MKDIAKWIWFAEECGTASNEMLRVLEKFGSVDEIYLANYDDFSYADISEHVSEKLSNKSLENAYSIIDRCESLNIGIVTFADDEYPKSLRSLTNPPAVLYYRGKLPSLNRRLCIAAVGTRNMSEYGMRAAYKIAYEVASSGAVVVSGMALGIDSVAASAAIAAKGKTVAVLGCGVDVVYPAEHGKLYSAICENGAVISEFPPLTPPRGFRFPIRNRIISGLSQGTVVIDAALKSGSMITAKNAILQGRDLYAVPSNIDSENSSGTNSLIRDGAQAVLCGRDIIKNYSYVFDGALNMDRLKDSEKRSEFDSSVLTSLGVRASGDDVDRVASQKKATKKAAGGMVEKVKISKSTSTPREDGGNVVTPAAAKDKGDSSRAALESLSEKHRKIFEEIPLDRAIPTDYLVNSGFKLNEVIAALTVLEIKGLITSLPGGLYARK